MNNFATIAIDPTNTQPTHTETIIGARDGIRGTIEVTGAHHPIPARPTFDLGALMNAPKPVTPLWLKKASRGNGRCSACKTQYLKGELNASKHCRHCADELGEAHPFNS